MIQIELPFPAKILWPNGRGHHMAKHREFQKHKDWAHHATLASFCGRWPTYGLFTGDYRLLFTVYPKTRHDIDEDNATAAMKAYQDGIAAAMKIDDKHFKNNRIQFAEPVKNGRVTICVEAA